METASEKRNFQYVMKTNLTEDFKCLKTAPNAEIDYSWEVDNCPICLDVHDEPRTLACKHTFCRVCLQYTIDRTPPDTKHHERGFECVICGYFTKVVNYSVPRSEWAFYEPEDYRFPKSVTDPENGEDSKSVAHNKAHPRLKDDYWFIDWKISAFPKSYLLNRGLNPCKRLKNCYVFSKPSTSDNSEQDTETDNTNLEQDITETGNKTLDIQSEITAVTFYEDKIVLFDDGLEEIQIYNKTMSLEFSFKERDVFDLSVLGTVLYMTVPEERCIHLYDLLDLVGKDPLYLTMKCYGMDTFNDTLAVLLCDEQNMKYQVCVLKSIGIVSEIIELKGGKLQFKCPRELAMSAITRLVYVSDEEAGIVKCFQMDGNLNWERLVYGAGSLAVYNGYLMIAREYTSSIDVLIGGGKFNGRLQSSKYALIEPQCFAISKTGADMVAVDSSQLIHFFHLRRQESAAANHRSVVCSLL